MKPWLKISLYTAAFAIFGAVVTQSVIKAIGAGVGGLVVALIEIFFERRRGR